MKIIRKCDVCGKSYEADTRNLKRGWGLCCSKSCASKKREAKKGIVHRVGHSERRSSRLLESAYIAADDWADFDQFGDMELGIHE